MTARDEVYGIAWLDQHATLLRDSAISPAMARTRGYMSVDTKARLLELGFSAAQASVPGLLIPLHDRSGKCIGLQYRPDEPRQRDGKPIKYETPPGQKNRIDVPPGVGDALGDPAVDLWITEGARKADAATELGLACVSLSGVWNWRGSNDKNGKVAISDWDDIALNGRRVILAFDSDTASKPSVRSALDRLAAYLDGKGALVRVCTLPDGGDGKTGLDDYIAAGHGLDDLAALVQDRAQQSHSGRHGGSTRESAATALVALAKRDYRLGISTDDEPFAVPLTAPHLVRPLRGAKQGLRPSLSHSFHTATGKVAPAQALTEALLTLEGAAQQEQPEPLHLRVAEVDERLYLDLGDPTGRAVQVDSTGWQLVDDAPVLFRRTQLTASLPVPERGGSINELWSLLNVTPTDRPLVVAFLIAALMPTMPHPILALKGEQGSGKSTATATLSALLDPSPAQTRKPPREVDGWVTAASGSWVVAIDNVSGVTDWWSDSLCRAVTGDGDVRRTLYSNADLSVFSFRRVIILNGIDLGAVRDDLAERLLTIELNRIDEHARRLDRDLSRRWAELHPRLLGVLLDLTVRVLTILPELDMVTMPRMADFARVLAAVDVVLDTSGLDTYLCQSGELAADAVESDPVLTAIVQRVRQSWTGGAGELRAMITPSDFGWRAPKEWPANSRQMTALLRRRSPALRKLGWVVDDLGRGGHDNLVRFTLVPPADRIEVRGAGDKAGDMAGDRGSVRAITTALQASPASDARTVHPASPGRTPSTPSRAGDAGDAHVLPLSSDGEREQESDGRPFTPRGTRGDVFASPASPAELGPCSRCREVEVIRYGERADPICSDCRRALRVDAVS